MFRPSSSSLEISLATQMATRKLEGTVVQMRTGVCCIGRHYNRVKMTEISILGRRNGVCAAAGTSRPQVD